MPGSTDTWLAASGLESGARRKRQRHLWESETLPGESIGCSVCRLLICPFTDFAFIRVFILSPEHKRLDPRGGLVLETEFLPSGP